jgi:predicted nuclease with RNAse H fold
LAPNDAVQHLASISGRCKAIAIDSPPRAQIKGPKTRAAERELVKAGYKVQYTSRVGRSKPAEWMENGQRLWEALEKKFSKRNLAEAFPTPSSDKLHDIDLSIGLKHFAGKEKHPFYKDYIDAAICALVAEAYLNGKTKRYGDSRDDKDELGPIHVLI